MKPVHAIKHYMDTYVDYTAATIASLLLGGIVFGINYSHGPVGASTAALKQAAYTFFIAGLITRNNENLALKFNNRITSLIIAVTVSSCLAIGLTFLMHSMKGTPEPLYSTIPTILMAIPGFTILGWRKQREQSMRRDSGSSFK
jgi:ABC-type Mn2+/Zn2+ transport system permease subunit